MNLSETYQSLKTTLFDWPSTFINRRDKKDEDSHNISWNKYTRRERIIDIRRSDLIEIVKSGQYSFQIIEDGSVFQLYYQFNDYNQALCSANLAYYNTGGVTYDTFQEMQFSDLYNGDDKSSSSDNKIDYKEDLFEDPLIAWIRIDYSPHDYCRPLHHSCHMHFSLFPNSRISLNAVPTPRQFIEFILAINYPDLYLVKRLDQKYEPNDPTRIADLNIPSFPRIDSSVYSVLPHISIPNH
nr:DUF2290 domain-containing protein [uncultured Methanoregula sp.]